MVYDLSWLGGICGRRSVVGPTPDRELGGDHQGPGFVPICFRFLAIGGPGFVWIYFQISFDRRGESVFGPSPKTTRDLDLILGQDNDRRKQWGILFKKFDGGLEGHIIPRFD